MKEQIMIREFKENDSKTLEKIIREAWKYDELAGPETASMLARVYLYSCLANQTFVRVAETEGIPVGVIMGKNIRKHKCPLKYRVKQVLSVILLFLSREGRQIAGIFRSVNGIDQKLLENCKKDYEGEIAFFAVDSKFRGRGIGKRLFQSVTSYMRQERIHSLYLFTDTSCNYGFYEHEGMNKSQEYAQTFHIHNQQANMKFFLYDIVLP